MNFEMFGLEWGNFFFLSFFHTYFLFGLCASHITVASVFLFVRFFGLNKILIGRRIRHKNPTMEQNAWLLKWISKTLWWMQSAICFSLNSNFSSKQNRFYFCSIIQIFRLYTRKGILIFFVAGYSYWKRGQY